MKITESYVGWVPIHKFDKYIVCSKNTDPNNIYIMSFENFQLIKEIYIDIPSIQHKANENIIIFHSYSDTSYLYILNLTTFLLERVEKNPNYSLFDFNLFGINVLYSKHDEKFYFADSNFDIIRRLNLKQNFKLAESGILYYNINNITYSDDNSIWYEDIASGNRIWEIELSDKIKSCNIWNDNFLIQTIINKKYVLLSIEIRTGEIKWKIETIGTFLLFDYPENKVLSCSSNVIETIDLINGHFLKKSETNVKKLRHFTAYYCLDELGIYYGYSASGNPTQLGKINRNNEIVEWEYTYLTTNPPPNYLYKWYILNNNMHLMYISSPKNESHMILVDPASEENKKLRTIINDEVTTFGLEIKDRKFPNFP